MTDAVEVVRPRRATLTRLRSVVPGWLGRDLRMNREAGPFLDR